MDKVTLRSTKTFLRAVGAQAASQSTVEQKALKATTALRILQKVQGPELKNIGRA